MRKWIAVPLLLFCCVSLARGQCQPTNSPTLDFSNSATVAPNKVPFAAVTLNVSATNGSDKSHKMTVGSGVAPGTNLQFNWNVYNTASATISYSWNGATNRTPWLNLSGSSGSWQWTTPTVGATNILRIFIVGTEKPGSGSFTSTTQDVVTLTITNQSPAIYRYDNLPSNGYVMVSLNYNGTPNIPYLTTCPNAAEKDMVPTAQLQLANTTSGENRNGVTLQGATTVVGQPVSAIAYDYISWLPGDVITTESGGFVYCSAIGDFWNTLENPMIEPAITRVSWNPSTHKTQPYCTPPSSPPDYSGPTYVPTNWKDPITGQGPAGFMDWEAIGVAFMGPWLFPYSINGASGRNVPGIYPPVVPDCTNSAAGIYPPVFPF